MFSSHKKRSLCDVTEMRAKAMVVITLQYLSASSQHIAHFKYRQFYKSIISQLNWKKCSQGAHVALGYALYSLCLIL